MFVISFRLIKLAGRQLTTNMPIPKRWVYWIFPPAFGAFVFQTFVGILQGIRDARATREVKDDTPAFRLGLALLAVGAPIATAMGGSGLITILLSGIIDPNNAINPVQAVQAFSAAWIRPLCWRYRFSSSQATS